MAGFLPADIVESRERIFADDEATSIQGFTLFDHSLS